MDTILQKSAELELALLEFFSLGAYDDSRKLTSSRIMCSVAFEHAESVKILIASGNYTSAMGVARIQFEALVRAMWLLYSASDSEVSVIMNELSEVSAKQSNKLPMLSKMLKSLETDAPKEPIQLLMEFKENSWRPMSSYVHGGAHAINRHSEGYPTRHLIQVLKASNGISVMAGSLLVVLSGEQLLMKRIREIQNAFSDCLLVLKENGT